MGSRRKNTMAGRSVNNIDASTIPALKDCVHCGLCLPECPTYFASGREAESPRGRIAALRAVVESRSSISDAIHDGMESCLVCRACESACPSGISMEHLMAHYRHESRPHRGDLSAGIESWLLKRVIPHPARIGALLGGLRLLGPLLRVLPATHDLPSASRLRPEPEIPHLIEAKGEVRGTVSILRGCVADRLFRRETHLSGRLLSEAGWRVVVPPAGCCGALHHHAGLIEEARQHSSHRWKELYEQGIDHVVVDGAGCGAHLLSQAPPGAPSIIDTATLLAQSGNFEIKKKLKGRTVLSVPCHQQHSALSLDGGTDLLVACIEERVELPEPDHCCGAAGMYLLRRRKMSRMIGDQARTRFERSGADTIISGNPGCLLRWEGLLGPKNAIHPVRLLAHACHMEPL